MHGLHCGGSIRLLGGVAVGVGEADLIDGIDAAADGFQQHDQAHSEHKQLPALHTEAVEQQPAHGKDRHNSGGQGGHHAVGADDAVEQQGHGQDQRRGAPAAQPFQLGVGPEGHKDHGKGPQEAEAVGQHIGEMGAVPQIVQGAEQEAVGKEQQQQHREDPLPQGDPLAAQIDHRQDHGEEAAEDVRAALHGGGLRQSPHAGEHRAQSLQRNAKSRQERAESFRPQGNHQLMEAHPGGGKGGIAAEGGRLSAEEAEQLRQTAPVDLLHGSLIGHAGDLDDVHGVGFRELVDGRGGALQPQIGGDRQHSRHAHGDQTEQGDAPEAGPEAGHVVPVDHVPADEDQHDPDADEQADVVAAIDGQRQADHIEHVAAIPQQAEGPQGHQGQQGHRVQPDGVPIVAHHKGAEGVGRGEEGHRQLVPAKGFFQEDGTEQPRQTDADQHRQGVPGQQKSLRQQRRRQIQRAGQIIGKQRQVAGPHAGIPGVQQGPPVLQPGPQIQEEGIVLVPLVMGQYHFGAKGDDSADRPHHAHDEQGQEKGCQIQIAGFARSG